ncbi:MAG: YdcF family protein [Sporomusaceae bacterium]|nr:YdcF family protein [Sporomusaceae bacterium]
MITAKKAFLTATILLTFFLFIEVPIIDAGLTSQPKPSDVLIVLGARLIGHEPSAVLQLRLQEAYRLYEAGYAKKIIVSGAKGSDEDISEAQAMKDYFLQQGVSEDVIYMEEHSYNTYQNLANSKKIMEEMNCHNAIIVSNTSHIHRALLLANQIGLEATGAPAPLPNNIYFTAKQYAREGAAAAALLFIPSK